MANNNSRSFAVPSKSVEELFDALSAQPRLTHCQKCGLGDAAKVGMLLFGEQNFAPNGHDSFDANSLVMVTLRQATSRLLFPDSALEEASRSQEIHSRS